MIRRKPRVLLFALGALVASVCTLWLWIERHRSYELQPPETQSETVLLIHGLLRTSASMDTLRGRLEQAGYHVSNWDYQSTQGTIETHGQRLANLLADLAADPNVERIHIVGHSLGGIVARYALTIERPAKMGRVVMLAPPNKGSASARKWAPLLDEVVEPLGQLSDDPQSTVNQLPTPEGIDFGIIAAASDGKVSLDDTHLRGEADHLVVPGYHTFIMNREDVSEQVIHFLRYGRFDRH